MDDDREYQDEEEEQHVYELECTDGIEEDIEYEQLDDLKSLEQQHDGVDYDTSPGHAAPQLANTIPNDESFDLKEDVTAV